MFSAQRAIHFSYVFNFLFQVGVHRVSVYGFYNNAFPYSWIYLQDSPTSIQYG